MTKIIAQTLQSLSEYASMEVEKILGRKPSRVSNSDSLIIFDTKDITHDSVLLTLFSETIKKFFLYLGSWQINDEQDLYTGPMEVDWSAFIPKESTFAVRPIVKNSIKIRLIGKQVGQAIIDKYYKLTGVKLRVNLSSPDIEIYAWVFNKNLLLGLNLSGDELNSDESILARSTLLASKWDEKSSFSEVIYSGISVSALRLATRDAQRSRLRHRAFIVFPFIDKETILKLARKGWKRDIEPSISCYEMRGRINLIKQAYPEVKKIAIYDIDELEKSDSVFIASNLLTSIEKKSDQAFWLKKIVDTLKDNSSWKSVTILARADLLESVYLSDLAKEKSIIFKGLRAKMVTYTR